MIKEAFVKKTSCLMMTMLLAVTGFFFVSCGSDSDGDGGGSTQQTPVTLRSVSIYSEDTAVSTVKVGASLTAYPIDTSNKSGDAVSDVSYKWYESDSRNGNYTEIADATGKTFVVPAGYYSKWIKVEGTKSELTVESIPVQVSAKPSVSEVSVSSSSASAKFGSTLTASAKDSENQTISVTDASWKWLAASEQDGNYTEISGATSNEYVVKASDAGKWIKVSVTWNESTKESNPKLIGALPTVTATVSGTVKALQNLTVTAKDSDNNTENFTYQWQASQTKDGTYTDIAGETATSYTIKITDAKSRLFIRAKAVETFADGTAIYGYTEAQQIPALQQVSSVGISGVAKYGQTLTATVTYTYGSTTEENLVEGDGVVYQWYRADSETADSAIIENAVSRTYTLAELDSGKYIFVKASKNDSSEISERVNISALPAVNTVSIEGTLKDGHVLTATATDTDGGTTGFTYEWFTAGSNDENAVWTSLGDASETKTYTVIETDADKYIKVKATKVYTSVDSPSKESAAQKILPLPTIASVSINGTFEVNQELTATATNTDNDTVTGDNVAYEWQIADSANGTFSAISEATSPTYTVTLDDAEKYIRVKVSKHYTVADTDTEGISDSHVIKALQKVTSVNVGGTVKVGSTLTATPVFDEGTDAGSAVTYKWQKKAVDASEYTDIDDATTSAYKVAADYAGATIKVVATRNGGSGEWISSDTVANGTLSSSYTLTYGNSTISAAELAITAGSSLNETLTVSDLTDATSGDSVTGTAVFSDTNAINASKNVTVTISATGYESLTKNVFVTVKATTPTAPSLATGDATNTFTADKIAFAQANSTLEYALTNDENAVWNEVTATPFTVDWSNDAAKKIYVRVKEVGTAGTEGFVAKSDVVEVSYGDSNKGGLPSVSGITATVTYNDIGALSSNASGNTVTITAATGYDSYIWKVDGVTDSGATGNTYTLTVVSGKVYSVDVIATKTGENLAHSAKITIK